MPFIEVQHEQLNSLIFLMQLLFNCYYFISKLFIFLLQPTTGVLFLLQLQSQLLYEFLSLVVQLAIGQLQSYLIIFLLQHCHLISQTQLLRIGSQEQSFIPGNRLFQLYHIGLWIAEAMLLYFPGGPFQMSYLAFQLCDPPLQLGDHLLHLHIGPLAVLGIHVQLVQQRCDPILEIHPRDLLDETPQFLHYALSGGLLAEHFQAVCRGSRAGNIGVGFVHAKNRIIMEWRGGNSRWGIGGVVIRMGMLVGRRLFLGVFELLLQFGDGLLAIFGNQQLLLIQFPQIRAFLLQSLVIFVQCFQLSLQILIFLALCLNCVPDLINFLLKLFSLQGVHIFLQILPLREYILIILFQLGLEAIETVYLLIALINNHPQSLALLPLSRQFLHQACTPQPLLLHRMQPSLLDLPHHHPSLFALPLQLICQGDHLSVQLLIGTAYFQEITLESCHLPPQGIALPSCPFGTSLQGTVLVDESVDICSGVGWLSRLLSSSQLLEGDAHVLELSPQIGVFLTELPDFIQQLLLLLRRRGETRRGIGVQGEIEERFAGSHSFDLRVVIEGRLRIGLICISLDLEVHLSAHRILIILGTHPLHQYQLWCLLFVGVQLWLRGQLSIHINLFDQKQCKLYQKSDVSRSEGRSGMCLSRRTESLSLCELIMETTLLGLIMLPWGTSLLPLKCVLFRSYFSSVIVESSCAPKTTLLVCEGDCKEEDSSLPSMNGISFSSYLLAAILKCQSTVPDGYRQKWTLISGCVRYMPVLFCESQKGFRNAQKAYHSLGPVTFL